LIKPTFGIGLLLVAFGLHSEEAEKVLDVSWQNESCSLPADHGTKAAPSRIEPFEPRRRERGEEYALPLEVHILSVGTRSSGQAYRSRGTEVRVPKADDRLVFDVRITNKGPQPFRMPAEPCDRVHRKASSQGRRTFALRVFALPVNDRNQSLTQIGGPMAQTFAAANAPDSFLKIGPGQSVRVRFAYDLRAFGRLLQPVENPRKPFAFQVGAYEFTTEDRPSDIRRMGGEVLSSNTVAPTVDWEQPWMRMEPFDSGNPPPPACRCAE
jgi:hypothetical protein